MPAQGKHVWRYKLGARLLSPLCFLVSFQRLAPGSNVRVPHFPSHSSRFRRYLRYASSNGSLNPAERTQPFEDWLGHFRGEANRSKGLSPATGTRDHQKGERTARTRLQYDYTIEQRGSTL